MKVYAMIADGTEEIECLCVVDVLRRAGIGVTLTSVCGKRVVSSHGIEISADAVIDDVDMSDADMIFIPGGMPGTLKLAQCDKLIASVKAALQCGKRVAAICAAPAHVLGANGLLRGKRAVCYPGHEGLMQGCVQCDERVVTDGLITTAKGMGCSLELGLEIVKLLAGEECAKTVSASVLAR